METGEGGRGPAWENVTNTAPPLPDQGTPFSWSPRPLGLQFEVLAASKHKARKSWACTWCDRCQLCLEVSSQRSPEWGGSPDFPALTPVLLQSLSTSAITGVFKTCKSDYIMILVKGPIASTTRRRKIRLLLGLRLALSGWCQPLQPPLSYRPLRVLRSTPLPPDSLCPGRSHPAPSPISGLCRSQFLALRWIAWHNMVYFYLLPHPWTSLWRHEGSNHLPPTRPAWLPAGTYIVKAKALQVMD